MDKILWRLLLVFVTLCLLVILIGLFPIIRGTRDFQIYTNYSGALDNTYPVTQSPLPDKLLYYLPEEITNRFVRVTSLNVWTTISGTQANNDLHDLKYLKDFDLYGDYASLKPGPINFSGCEKLESIYLTENSRDRLILTNCKSLKYLSFSNFQVEQIKDFDHCKNLKILEIAYNKPLPIFPKLEQLTLSSSLHQWPDLAFPELTSLKVRSGNSPNAFSAGKNPHPWPKLKTLHLVNIPLKEVPPTSHFSNIEELYLDRLKISKIPELHSLKNLKNIVLNLSLIHI